LGIERSDPLTGPKAKGGKALALTPAKASKVSKFIKTFKQGKGSNFAAREFLYLANPRTQKETLFFE
jgi:hypothetical protein